MRATARVVAVADGRGGTRLAVLQGEVPLLPRRTGSAGPGPVTVHLVGGAAGPLGGDDLRLEISVGPDAQLRLRSVAATVALPGRGGAESRLIIRVDVASGGELDWQPEPLVAAAGCRHRTESTVEVAAGGRLTWREELVCGRHDEPAGDAVVAMVLRYAGRALYSNELAVGPAAAGWAGPAVLGGARTTGTLLMVNPDWVTTDPPAADPARAGASGACAAVLALPGPAVLAAATGPDLPQVRAAIAGVLGSTP